MKIAVLSDIHANSIALKSVLDEAKQQGVDHLFLLGDQLGYYYEANEVFEMIKEWPYDIIAGNHERLFGEYLTASTDRRNKINEKYGYCFAYYENSFSINLIESIKQLTEQKRIEKDGLTFLLCHGSPTNKDLYLYPDATKNILQENEVNGFDYILCGHTHYPMVYVGRSSVIINVGSVGQSRTVGGIANWGIINTKNGIYTPQNTPYDIEKAIINLNERNEKKEYLFTVLKRNNTNYEI